MLYLYPRGFKSINNNSTNWSQYNNYSHDNAGGILVFDLPDLVVKSGKSVRVYDNVVVDNNFKNFAPSGNVVASVPSGTGIMVLATSDVEIYLWLMGSCDSLLVYAGLSVVCVHHFCWQCAAVLFRKQSSQK